MMEGMVVDDKIIARLMPHGNQCCMEASHSLGSWPFVSAFVLARVSCINHAQDEAFSFSPAAKTSGLPKTLYC